MRRFVKPDVIADAPNKSSIDFQDKKNLLSPKDFKFSHSIRSELRKVTIKDVDMLAFKQQCVEFLKAICLKMIEKSPLKY